MRKIFTASGSKVAIHCGKGHDVFQVVTAAFTNPAANVQTLWSELKACQPTGHGSRRRSAGLGQSHRGSERQQFLPISLASRRFTPKMQIALVPPAGASLPTRCRNCSAAQRTFCPGWFEKQSDQVATVSLNSTVRSRAACRDIKFGNGSLIHLWLNAPGGMV